jgi:tetratricopeptide (TPR) repeat protein
LFSSQAADPWNIPPNQHLQLIQMYRDLAMREVRMGRHRRAAYIYAELLGDVLNAAMTLEAGSHYREAAILFRDRLSRRQDAARCLELAGLFDEAAELYVEVGMIEEAANLYNRLQRHDEAQQLLRKWVEQLTTQGHFLRASEIVHRKLDDLDGAISVLDTGWNLSGSAAELCQDRVFVLLSESSRHDEASRRVAALLQSTKSGSRHHSIAKVLSAVARNYVDQTIRDKAADATRVVVARRLGSAYPSESNPLLGAIRSLAPQDKLLARDCDRYGRQRTPTTPPVVKPRATHDVMTLARTIQLPDRHIEWRLAKSNGEALYVAGFTNTKSNDGLALRRLPWTDPLETKQVTFWINVSPDRRLLFDLARDGNRRVMIHSVGSPPLAARKLLIESSTEGTTEIAGSPTWASESTLDFTVSNSIPFAWRVRTFMGILEITGFNPKGDEVTKYSWNHPMPDMDPTLLPISVCASASPIRIGVASFLFHPVDPMTSAPYIQLEHEIDSLENYRDAHHDCVMALFGVGGVLIQEPFYDNRPQAIAEGLESPHGTFLYGGRIVVAGRDECRVYRLQNGRAQEVARMKLDAPAIAVVRTDHIAQFAVVCSDNVVRVFELK